MLAYCFHSYISYEKIRIACATGSWQTGQSGVASASHTRLAQSKQKRLCPHGTRAASTSFSPHTRQSRRPPLPAPPLLPLTSPPKLPRLVSESVGETDAAGDGRVTGTDEPPDGKDQMLEGAVAVSNDGDSPSPSSRSRLPFQIDTKSPRRLPWPPEPDELEEELQDPDDEKAPVLPVDDVMVGKEMGMVASVRPVAAAGAVGVRLISRLLNNDPRPDL